MTKLKFPLKQYIRNRNVSFSMKGWLQKKIFAPLDQQEILPTKGDFFGIPRLKNDQNNKIFFREFNKRPPFHLIHVPYIFQKRNRELLLPPLPLIGTFSLFPYLFFLDCVPNCKMFAVIGYSNFPHSI